MPAIRDSSLKVSVTAISPEVSSPRCGLPRNRGLLSYGPAAVLTAPCWKQEKLTTLKTDLSAAEQLRDLINAFVLDAKVVERKEHYIVYLKEGEQIVDLLNIMEAPLALMDLENVRIVKEMRNDINRKVNCETANLNKVVGAAVKQLEDINYIEETIGLARLPEQLAEVARVRLEYPDRSLKELGSFLMTPVGKSGVNHRLRKISSIAEALREGKGGIE